MNSGFPEIDAACAAFAQLHQLPGLAAGIVQKGVLVHTVTVGLADLEAARAVRPDTAFRIASMTKNMTALAILALRDQGRLTLDAPLSEYVPQFGAVPPATRDSPPVTVRMLMSHAAGFVTDDPWGDRVLGMTPGELDGLIARGRLFARPPGVAFEYSNLGYALLGRVLTNLSGTSYQSFIGKTFLAPLGMTRTTFDPQQAMGGDFAWGYRLDEKQWSRERVEPDGEVGAMGGLITTVPDYARWVAFLLSAWPPRDEPETGPVRRSTIREMGLWHSMPYLPDVVGGRAAAATAYGAGLMDSDDPKHGRRLHHPGGLPGYGSHVSMLPARGWGVFAFANRTYAPMSRLTVQLIDLLHDAAPKPSAAVSSPALKRAVEAVVAAYGQGRIAAAGHVFAVNFLLDTPARYRDAELSALKRRLGGARLTAIEPTHALAGRFTLACERGELTGTIVLSPDAEPGIQKLTLVAKDA